GEEDRGERAAKIRGREGAEGLVRDEPGLEFGALERRAEPELVRVVEVLGADVGEAGEALPDGVAGLHRGGGDAGVDRRVARRLGAGRGERGGRDPGRRGPDGGKALARPERRQ